MTAAETRAGEPEYRKGVGVGEGRDGQRHRRSRDLPSCVCVRACTRARVHVWCVRARTHARVQLMGKELLALFRYSD